jgi:F0F1-type ATP synthase membrane subunit b/b'
MKLSGGSASVWPGYVAAVASLLLSLLLLAGVLVVAISQLGRVVGSYNRQLLVELIEDERRSEEIDELGKKGQALAVASAQAKVAAAQALEQAQRRARQQEQERVQGQEQALAQALAKEQAQVRAQEQSLNAQLSQKANELAAAQSELARLELLTRQAGVVRGGRSADKIYRFAFGAGAQGLEAEVVKDLRAALSRQELAQRRWLIEAGAKGVSVVGSREIFRLMISLRSELQEMGLATDKVRLVLNTERSPQEFTGGANAGDIVIVLRPDGQDRAPS